MNHPMMLPDTTVRDHHLIEAFIGGDQSAFAELVTRHAAIVYASCRRQLGSADADDAAQATFLVLARKPAEAAKAPVLAAWLLRVARNVSSNLRRGRQRRARAEQEAAMATTPAAAAERAPEPDALAHLDELLDSLPEHERRVVVMHVMQGVDQDEVARLLGCPAGTVRSRLSRALSRLRDALARRGMVLSLGALATLLASNANAAPPPGLIETLTLSPTQQWPAGHAVARAAHEAERALRPRHLVGGAIGVAAATLIGVAAWWALSSSEAPPAPRALAPRAAPAVVADTTAAAPSVDPNAYLPSDPNLSVRLNDWHRTIDRLSGTPYAAFMATPSGAFLAKSFFDDAPKVRAWDPRSLRRAVFAAHLKPGAAAAFGPLIAKGDWGRIGEVMEYSIGAELAPGDPLIEAPIRQSLAVNDAGRDWTVARPWGAMVRRGRLLLASNREQEDRSAPTATGPQAASYAGADFECVSTPTGDELGADTAAFRMWSTLTEHGMRSERLLGPNRNDAPVPVAPLNARLLRSLPADTLVAFTRRCTEQDLDLAQALSLGSLALMSARADSAEQKPHGTATVSVTPAGVDAQVQADEQTKERVAAMTQTLAGFGIPAHLTLDGDVLIYARAGEPWPSLTIAAAVPEDQGRALVSAAARLLAAQPGDDGTVSGSLLGMLPLAAAYRDGTVVITTHPDGIASHLRRSGGFDAIPEVADAIAAIPADAYGACVANGPAAWSALARIGQRFNGNEQAKAGLATLADDLAACCRGHREVMYTTASAGDRRSYAEGPVFGLLGLIIDAGMGGLPLKAIWN